MNNYWLCITSDENWKIIKTKHIWAVKEKDRKTLDKMAVGDLLAFYVKQRIEGDVKISPQIKGIFKVSSNPFNDSSSLFANVTPREEFVHRISIEPFAIANKGIDFRELIPKMEFIKNSRMWYTYMEFTSRKITKKDFDAIFFALKDKT